MNIIPISNMSMLQNSPLVGKSQMTPANQLPFQNALNQAIQDLQETSAVREQDSQALAVGEVDDLAQIMIHSEKADIALQMVVELRNKVLDAYSEIMRFSI